MIRNWFLICLFVAGMLRLPASIFAQDATPTVPPGVTIHVVQRGETLFRIARDYGLTVNDLVRLNGISDPSTIYVGQRLLVPVEGSTPAPSQSVMHVVQPGETLGSIANLYGLTVADLIARNQLTDTGSFYVGELLDVSSAAAPTAEATKVPDVPRTPEAVVVHTVARGETMFRIAQQYGVTVNELAQVNDISDPTLIYAGQELIIPGFEPPQIAFDMPEPVESLEISPLVFVEGKTGRVHLTTDSAVTVAATFIDQTLHDASDEGATQHTLLIGIPVGTAANIYPLILTLTDSAGIQTALPINVQIIDGGYARERITLSADRAKLLDPATEDDELNTLRSITSNFTPTRYFDGPMGLPSSAPLSSRFGSHRSYNGGEFSRIHTGTDFAAASGSPIIAPAAGRIAFVGRLDIRGNVTIIDHGWGVFTVYCHQTEQYVSAGDMVTAGQVIGSAGSTGRVTGPHLHWEVWLDGIPVDGMQWVRESFS